MKGAIVVPALLSRAAMLAPQPPSRDAERPGICNKKAFTIMHFSALLQGRGRAIRPRRD
jgi:hypothetical protein